jgi:hypothetical protein
MADEAPAPPGGAPAQGGGGGGGGGGKGAQIDSHAHLHESVRQMKESTHKRTITKDALDAHVSGIATPMSRPLSRHSLDLDDYFVSYLLSRYSQEYLGHETAHLLIPHVGWPTRSRWTFEASIFHAYAWQCSSANDYTSCLHWSVGHFHHLHL